MTSGTADFIIYSFQSINQAIKESINSNYCQAYATQTVCRTDTKVNKKRQKSHGENRTEIHVHARKCDFTLHLKVCIQSVILRESHECSRQKYCNILYDILYTKTTDGRTFNQSKKTYTRHLNKKYSPRAAAQLKPMRPQQMPKVGNSPPNERSWLHGPQPSTGNSEQPVTETSLLEM